MNYLKYVPNEGEHAFFALEIGTGNELYRFLWIPSYGFRLKNETFECEK